MEIRRKRPRLKPNHFVHRIEKEEVNTMPIVAFTGKVVIVNTIEGCHQAMEYLNAQTMVGVDTETRPSFVRGVHYPTALVQIATEERCYLFQLGVIGMPQELADFFANENICKVGLAFKEDISGLKKLRNFNAKNCIDVQQKVGQYGILDLGLQKIYAIIFGQKISKAQQLTNWANLNLTEDQARYASTDAWATLRIWQELRRTCLLSRKEAEALRQADLALQYQHQQEKIKEKEAELQTEKNISGV